MKVEEVISEIFAEQFHMEEPSHSIFLSALDAAGYAVVPKEPTEDMILAAEAVYSKNGTWRKIYRAMIEAADEKGSCRHPVVTFTTNGCVCAICGKFDGEPPSVIEAAKEE